MSILYLILIALLLSSTTLAILYARRLKRQLQASVPRQELENNEKKMQLAIETSDLVQWEYNNVTRVFHSSNERIKSNETRLVPEDYIRAVHPQDQKRVQDIIDLMDRGEDEPFLFNKRLKYSEDDNWHYTTVNGVPYEKDKNGKVITYTGFRRDDTEWKSIKDYLEAEREKVMEADKLKSTFLANMSHEIRTPLNAIVGFSQLLLIIDDPQEKEEYAQIILNNNDLLLRLINDILDLSKIESGLMTVSCETFDMVPFFNEFALDFKKRMTKVDLRIVNPYHKCIVTLDKVRIAQVLNNFMTNAIKYTSDGYIEVGYEYTENGIRIYVQDTGIGIPQAKHHLVFERFEKLDSFVQGTGLGLSICKAIMDIFNGRIGFTSEESKGSTFWAWIACHADIEQKRTD